MINNKIGTVVIGRNEGERLRTCLESLSQRLNKIVYVDSGSTDGSVNLANKLGVTVVALDMTQPFTAARARNTGFKSLESSHPGLKYVQFIDGDCELAGNWLETAMSFLEQNPEFAVTCGRRRERFPEQSTYNLLCDIEWDTPVGGANACGGDALIRAKAFDEVSGYRDSLIAGEEPEMCFRLRQNGWKIYRLDTDMTWHDAAIHQFRQWWQRSKRSGFAYANGYALHGQTPEKFCAKQLNSILFWGAAMPTCLLLLGLVNPWFVLGWAVYGLQILRIARNAKKRKSIPARLSFIYASFIMLAKFPQICGVIQFWSNQWQGKTNKIIEYK